MSSVLLPSPKGLWWSPEFPLGSFSSSGFPVSDSQVHFDTGKALTVSVHKNLPLGLKLECLYIKNQQSSGNKHVIKNYLNLVIQQIVLR